MAVYVFSLLTGFFTGGVDYAQGTRQNYLKKMNIPVKYIYTSVPNERDLLVYEQLGIDTKSMLVAPFFLSGKKEIGSPDQIRKKDIFSRGYLIAREHYAGDLMYTDYFVPVKEKDVWEAKLTKRTFRNPEGQVVFDIIIDEKGDERYWYPNGENLSKQEFLCRFIQKLNLTKEDIVLIDRPGLSEFVQPLFMYGNKAKIVVFFHSVHYAQPGEAAEFAYLNYHYYYWFKNSDKIHTIIVSTEAQKLEVIEKLKEYGCQIPNMEVIPICGLDKIRIPSGERKPYSLVTASRFVPGKKIDWIIRSVIKAHEKNPKVNLDIYGEGSVANTGILRGIIEEHHAQDYVHFMGHQNMKERYTGYEAYISASLGESFGLTLLDAAGSGEALIGLDAKYGNHVFIKNGENGYLADVDFSKTGNAQYVETVIQGMADKIVELFADEQRLQEFHEKSYEIAEEYMEYKIEKRWIDFIEKNIKE